MTDSGQLSDDDQRQLDAAIREFRQEIRRTGNLPDISRFTDQVPESLRNPLQKQLAPVIAEYQAALTLTPQGSDPDGERPRLVAKPEMPAQIPPESSRPTSIDPGTESPETVIIPQPAKPSAAQKDSASKTSLFSDSRSGSLSGGLSLREIIPSRDELNKYVVEEEIDRGGMGVVLRVRDERLQRTIALKVIRGQEGTGSSTRRTVDAGTLQRFIREAQVTGRLDHPGVVPIHELAMDENDRIYFTMKYVEGLTLKQVLQEHRSGSEHWTQARIVDAMIRVCETLAFAHSRDVIHRDLKPSNVMVGKFGEVYVMDWGLAKVLGESESEIKSTADQDDESASYRTMYGDAVGTPFYMPPEQAAGKLDQLDCRSDVYAAGAIVYELLTGQRPYWSDPPPTGQGVIRKVLEGPPVEIRDLNRKAAPELVAITRKAMSRSMADRYQSAADMAEDLRAFLSQRIVSAHDTGMVTRLKKWISRNQSLTIAGMLALLTTIGAMCVILVLQYSNRHEMLKKNAELSKTIREKEIANERALSAQRESEGLSFVSHAKSLTEAGDPELAALLAVEAVRRYPFHQATETLYAAADRVLPWADLKVPTQLITGDLAWIPGNRGLLVVGNGHGYIQSPGNAVPSFQLVNREQRLFRSACCSTDGTRILTSGDDGTLAVWDSATGLRTIEMDVGYPNVLGSDDIQRPRLIDAAFCFEDHCAVTVTSQHRIHLIDLDASRQLEVLEMPMPADNAARAPITSMKVSPDGRMLVVGDASGHVQLWNLEERRLIRSVQALYQPVGSLSFSSDGSRFVASAEEGGEGMRSVSDTARIWSVVSGEQLAEFESNGPGVTCAAWHPTQPLLVIGLSDSTVCLWDANTSAVVNVSDPQPDVVLGIRFSSDGRLLATQCGATDVVLWQLVRLNDTPQLLQRDHLVGHKENILRFEFDETGQRLATASRDVVRLWEISTRRPVPSFGHTVTPFRLLACPNGDHVFAADSDDKTGHLWRLPDLQESFPIDFGGSLMIAEFSRDQSHLVTMTADGLCRVWNCKTGRMEASVQNPSPAWAHSLHGQMLYLTGSDGTTAWDLTTGKIVRSVPLDGAVIQLIAGNGTVLFTNSQLGSVRSLRRTDLVSGTTTAIENAEVSGPAGRSPSGRLFWSCGSMEADGRTFSSDVVVVDVDAGRMLFTTHVDEAQVRSVSISSDDSRLLIDYFRHPSCTAEVYSIPDGKRLLQLGEPGEDLTGWSSTFSRIVTRSANQGTRLWHGTSGSLINRLDPTNATGLVDFSADGRLCAVQYQPPVDTSGPGFGSVTLWNAETGKLIGALPGQNTFRFGSAFVPGRQLLLTLSGAGTLRLWPVDMKGDGFAYLNRQLTIEERQMYGLGTTAKQAESESLREREWSALDEQIRLLIPVTTERRASAWSVLDQVANWLGEQPTPAEKSRALVSVGRLITGTFDTDPLVLSKIASLHERHGRLQDAARIMETAARHPRASSLASSLNRLRREIAPEVVSDRAVDSLIESARTEAGDLKRLENTKSWSKEQSEHFAAYIQARELQINGQFAEAAELLESLSDDVEAGPETILHRAECELTLGHPEQAFELIRENLTRDQVASPELWTMWLRIGFSDLSRSPRQLLDLIPPDPAHVAGDTPCRVQAARLLSTLAASQPIRINCGGGQYKAANGDVWMADAFYNSGLEYFGSLGDAALFSNPVRNTSDEVLYQSERYFDPERTDITPGYQIPVPNGTWSVILGFAEIYQEERSFDVRIENQTVLSNYDPSRTQEDWATAQQFTYTIMVNDGQLDLLFDQHNGTAPKISCIQIAPQSNGTENP